LRGISISEPQVIDAAVDLALAEELDLLVLDGTGGLGSIAAELNNRPRFELLKMTVNAFRQRRKEEAVTLVYAGGVRSGTDAARLIALGASAVVYGVAAALALGGTLSAQGISFLLDHTADERAAALGALLKANAGEASMMARCTGKTQLHNLEPEDLRAVTIATSTLTGIPLVGHRPARGGNGLAA
jgi:glutamate synthase domain-containing protein 2